MRSHSRVWTFVVVGLALFIDATRSVVAAESAATSAIAGSSWLWVLAALGAGIAGTWLFLAWSRARLRMLPEDRHALERADCVLWEAIVRREDETWHWRFNVHRTLLERRIFGHLPERKYDELWSPLDLPQLPEMNVRSRGAMLGGASGYTQVFRAIAGSQTLWISESVTIEPAGSDCWKLVGVATDVTEQHETEEKLRSNEAQALEILARADCLLWRADVVKEGDSIRWVRFDLPSSGLYDRVFGKPDSSTTGKLWSRVDAPDLPEMNARSRDAIFSGAPGYEQEVRVIKEGRTLWFHEQVSIVAKSADSWRLIGVLTDVTERHEAEAARRVSDERLQHLLARADCLLWQGRVCEDAEGRFEWQMYIPRSVLYTQLFGEGEKDARSLMWNRERVPDLQAMERRSQTAMRTDAPGYEQEFRVILGGRTFWLHEQVTITRAGPHEWNLVGVMTDISARRAADEAVRTSEARFRELFEHAPVAIVEADFSALGPWAAEVRASGVRDVAAHLTRDSDALAAAAASVRVLDVNEAAVELLRARTKEEIRGRLLGILPAATLGALVEAVTTAQPGRDVLESETEIRDLGGTDRHAYLRCWLGRKDGAFDLSRAVLAIVDLTDLKRTEAALAAEKERLAVTLRAMADGVITTDLNGRVFFLNRAAADMVEADGTAAVGRAVDEILRLHGENDRRGIEVPVARVAREDTLVDFAPQTRLIGRGGTVRSISGCCAPIHGADRKVTGTVIVFRDVTERERFEREMVRASKLESVGVLAGGIAHDFNNILTVIIGNLNLGLLDAGALPDLQHCLREAERAAMRARDLTQQLLTFAKGGDPVRTAVRLSEILTEAAAFAMHGSRVKCEFDIPDDLWPADADKGQIGQVVQNLVINAAQAMPEGGVIVINGRIVSLTGSDGNQLPPGNYVNISVADTGVGIKTENLSRIFDPYFTTKQQGSGLGLATVYSIVRKHRGDIDVESELGRGSTFRVRLPALPGREPAAGKSSIGRDPLMSGRVLFMDDEEPIRKVASAILRRLGLEVDLAADGAEAVARYRAACERGTAHEVVVMDLTVPGGMGGREALDHLRSIDPEVRAIVSSGYSSDPVLANFRAFGFRGVVTKPYQVDEFARVVRQVLESRAGRNTSGG